MKNLLGDIKYALKTLGKAPIFTGVAVLSLALGIGANTAIFTLLDQIMLRLLPVKEPQELALLSTRGINYGVPYLSSRYVSDMTVYLSTSVDPDQISSAVRSQVSQLDPNVPMFGMRSMSQQISNSLLIERLIASLSSVFGALATLLATIGLYGVMAYTVARRTREIGIRMALGADQGNVVWMVMREVLVLVAVGVVIGFGAAIGLTKYVKSQLFGLTAMDPVSLAAATIGLAVVACLAGYIPAIRASRINAMRALRYE